MADEQQQQHLPRQPAPSFDRLENFNFLLSRHDPALAKSRHYSFDAESTGLAPPPPLNNSVSMDYDQTEGMGGLSVSSYESLEDERSSLDLRGYPYGESEFFFFFWTPFLSFSMISKVAFFAPSPWAMVRFVQCMRSMAASELVLRPSGLSDLSNTVWGKLRLNYNNSFYRVPYPRVSASSVAVWALAARPAQLHPP